MPTGLTQDQARRFYDRFGARQDMQAFYEDKATTALIVAAGFDQARNVFELGCGTGRFAQKLLSKHLPEEARYLAVDVSPVMAGLAVKRLAPWSGRAHVQLLEDPAGSSEDLPVPAGCDRIVATYVFDLLPPERILSIVNQAHRKLEPEGRLCLTALTYGQKPVGRLVARGWEKIYRINPWLVGGCRPIRLDEYLAAGEWKIEYRQVVMAWGISSEVVVAVPSRFKPDYKTS